MSIEYFGVNSTYSPFSNSMSLRTVTNEKFDIPRDATFLNKPVISVATGLIPTNSSFLDESFNVLVLDENGNELIKLKKVLGKVGNDTYPSEYEVMWFDSENMQSVFWIHEKWHDQILSVTGDFAITTITAEFLNKEIREEIEEITKHNSFDETYPIGSIYCCFNNTPPKRGNWRRTGQGRVLVGLNEADGDFNFSRKTGGAKTHTLTIAEMPNHSHSYKTSSIDSLGIPDGVDSNGGIMDQARTYYVRATGGNGAHNNLQPYITVYMFERIS